MLKNGLLCLDRTDIANFCYNLWCCLFPVCCFSLILLKLFDPTLDISVSVYKKQNQHAPYTALQLEFDLDDSSVATPRHHHNLLLYNMILWYRLLWHSVIHQIFQFGSNPYQSISSLYQLIRNNIFDQMENLLNWYKLQLEAH